MQNFLRRLRATWLGGLLVLVLAAPAFAGPPRQFVVFGDSLSDPGNASNFWVRTPCPLSGAWSPAHPMRVADTTSVMARPGSSN